MQTIVSIIGEQRCRLGESPVWDPALKALFWIDSVAPAIWRYDPATGAQTSFPAPDLIGSIVLAEPGFLLAALKDRICRVDVAGGTFVTVAEPPAMDAGERLNDGKADRAGRLLCASLSQHGVASGVGKLYRFAPGATEVLERGIEIGNALCFSPAGDRMYFADSMGMAVWAYDYDARTGAVGRRSVLIDTRGHGSAPDGATVDAEGHLWVALVQAGQVARFAPDGRLDRLVDLPIPYPSCPAFGGEDMDILYVTAISDSGGRLVTDDPRGGRLMRIEALGVRGVAETRCRL